MILNSPYITGSITVTGNANIQGQLTVTGSLSGIASTASFALTLGGTGSVGFATTGAFTATSGSASSRLTQIEQVYATTGSNSFRATQSITGSLTVTGQIIAQTLNVQQVTSSIVYSSGSNTFGCDINSRQTFTGSFYQTGSIAIFNSCVGIGTNSPGGKLDVQASGLSSFSYYFRSSNGCYAGGVYNTAGCNAQLYLANSASVENVLISSFGNSFFNGGSVGIGTNSPSSILNPSSAPVLTIKSTTAGVYPSHVLQYINGQEAGITLASALYFDIAGDSTATNNNFIFRTSNTNSCNSLTERMRLTSAGNLGIGCNTPGYTLDVNGNVAATRFWVTSGGNATDPMIRVKDDPDTGIYFPSAGTMAFSTDAGERIRITSGGVVLVNTSTSAGGVFNTFKTPVNSNYVDQIIVQGTGNYPSLRLGTFDAYDGVIATTGNDLRILSGLNVTTENHNIRLYTSFNGGTTGAQNYERMRIEYNGAVLINTTSIPSNTRFYTALGDVEGFRFGNWQSYTYTTNNSWIAENTWFDGNFKRINSGYAYALYSDAASGMQMRVAGTSSANSTISWLNGITALPNGDVRNYNNSTTWQQSSDIKIKQNIRPISNVLDKITALNPTHFEFKNKPGVTKTGFIAQEFEQVFPGHVTELEPMSEYKEYFEDGEMIKSIDADLIPYLVKAIQELKAENDIFKTCLGIS